MNEETLFELAINTPAAELPALLDRECAHDPALRVRIEKLLAAHLAADDSLVPPAANAGNNPAESSQGAWAQSLPTSPAIGTVLGGKYKLVENIGDGGMGTVYMAQQTEPVKRLVAVKVIKAGLDSRAVLARFEAERQALAIMDHPNIAKVLDAGATDGGSPYFVMELVKGVPITKFCDENKLTPKERLELFLPVCEAIQHSHQKGIIHRDIKPSNVLVAMYDDRPVPKVIDFGVAKATERSLADVDLITGFGALVGTPEYMSPEQASLNNLDIDTRSDVYSLGVLLYELLSGHTPVDRKSMEQAAIYEILRIVRDVDAPRLSAKLSSIDTLPNVAANRKTEPKRLATQFRGELDWVLHKALEKDRTRRYSTANNFARDIQRYLSNEIVEARPPSTFYTLQKLVRRNKGRVFASSLVLIALLAGIAGTSWGMIRAEQRRKQAEASQAEESKQRAMAVSNEAKAVQAQQEEARQRTIAETETKRAVEARNRALDALRATTGEDVEKLIGEKKSLSRNEQAYLEAIASRWQVFAADEGTDELSRDIQGEGHLRIARLWDHLGRREDALIEYEKAAQIYLELTAKYPSSRQYAESLANGYNNLGLVLKDLGRQTEAQTSIGKSVVLNQRLAEQFPAVPDYRAALAGNHHNLAIVYQAEGNNSKALDSYRECLNIEEGLVREFPNTPDFRSRVATTHSNLGILLKSVGKHTEAQQEYQQALAVREQLTADFPSEEAYFEQLGQSYHNYSTYMVSLGNWDEAERQFNQAIAIKEKLAAEYPGIPEYNSRLALSYKNFGVMLRDQGKQSEALRMIRKSLAITEKLVASFPFEPEFRDDLAGSHNSLAILLRQLNRSDLALDQHRKALAIREKLVTDFAAIPDYRKRLAESHGNIGQLMRRLDKPEEADEHLQKAVAILEKLTAEFPEVTTYRVYIASIYDDLANLRSDRNQLDDAITLYRTSITLGERIVAENPAVPDHKVELAATYSNFSKRLLGIDKPAESLEWLQKAIELLEPVVASSARSGKSERYLRNCYESRSMAYDDLQRYAEGESDWNKFIELSPEENANRLLTPRWKRLISTGKVSEGIDRIWEMSKLPSEDPVLWYELACTFSLAAYRSPEKQEEYSNRAIEMLQEAVKCGYNDSKSLNSDSDLNAIRDRDDFKKIVTQLESSAKADKQPASTPESID